MYGGSNEIFYPTFGAAHDEDRNAKPVRVLTQCLENREPVHDWHHEIQKNDAGKKPGCEQLQCSPAVLGCFYLKSIRIEALTDDSAHLGIVVDDENPLSHPREAAKG